MLQERDKYDVDLINSLVGTTIHYHRSEWKVIDHVHNHVFIERVEDGWEDMVRGKFIEDAILEQQKKEKARAHDHPKQFFDKWGIVGKINMPATDFEVNEEYVKKTIGTYSSYPWGYDHNPSSAERGTIGEPSAYLNLTIGGFPAHLKADTTGKLHLYNDPTGAWTYEIQMHMWASSRKRYNSDGAEWELKPRIESRWEYHHTFEPDEKDPTGFNIASRPFFALEAPSEWTKKEAEGFEASDHHIEESQIKEFIEAAWENWWKAGFEPFLGDEISVKGNMHHSVGHKYAGTQWVFNGKGIKWSRSNVYETGAGAQRARINDSTKAVPAKWSSVISKEEFKEKLKKDFFLQVNSKLIVDFEKEKAKDIQEWKDMLDKHNKKENEETGEFQNI